MIAQVEGIGNLEFPDGTDPAVVQKTVKDLIAKKNAPKETGILSQFGRIKDIYFEEEKEGRKAMAKMGADPTGMNVIGGVLGALQWASAPVTAVAKGVAGEPAEKGLNDLGAPEPVAKFGGQLAETAAYFVPYGKAVQTAIQGKEALEASKTIGKVAKEIAAEKTKLPLEFPAKVGEEAVAEAQKPISEAHKKVVQETVLHDVIKEVKTQVSEKWVPTEQRRISQELVDHIANNPADVAKVSEKYNLTAQDLAAQIKETLTTSGRDLNVMSRLAKELRTKFETPYMKQLSDFMEKEVAETPALDKFGKVFKQVENVRRSALVSQFATSMRNIVSQGGRLTLGSVDDAFQGAANNLLKSPGDGTFNSIKSTLRGLGEGLDIWTATLSRLDPAGRKKITEILDTVNAVDAKAKMFNTPVQDVVLTGKISKTLNTFNTMQEYFFRNIAFESKLRQLSRNAGLDYAKVGAKDIPESMLNDAAEYALEMTFSAMPKSQFAKDWVKANSHPIMTALINPFPRFLYGNALPFLKNFSPVGFLEAVKPSVVADIVNGNPEKFSKAVSQATLGTIMLNTASYIRSSEYAGENWYEVKAGNKTIDTRAFAPFSTYLFLAESMQNPERIKPADFGQALLSLNRVGGTGLVLADILRGRDAATTIDSVTRVAGAYLSGFSVPARTIKDIYTTIDPDEAIIRDVKDDEFWGPSKANIPELSQTLPAARSPLRKGDLKTESPLLRQFTGLSTKTKNDLEKEVDAVRLPYQKIYPSTGDAEGDRKVSELMAEPLERAFPVLKNNTNYNQMDELTKRIILGEVFREAKNYARKKLAATDPELAMKIRIDKLPDDYERLLRKRGVIPPKGESK